MRAYGTVLLLVCSEKSTHTESSTLSLHWELYSQRALWVS